MDVYSNSERAAGLQVWWIVWRFFVCFLEEELPIGNLLCVKSPPSSDEPVASVLLL